MSLDTLSVQEVLNKWRKFGFPSGASSIIAPWDELETDMFKYEVVDADIGEDYDGDTVSDYSAGSKNSTKMLVECAPGTYGVDGEPCRVTVFQYIFPDFPKFASDIKTFNTTFGAAFDAVFQPIIDSNTDI